MARSRRPSRAIRSLGATSTRGSSGILKTPGEIDAMAASGAVLARAHAAMARAVAVGVTTAELDAIAEQVIRDAGAEPAFLGYHGFPATICPSVNDEVVHAIPGDYALIDGDLISIDCGAVLDGWVSDAARTYVVGGGNAAAMQLSETTERALAAGIAAAQVGRHIGDIGHAVQRVVEAEGFSCVESLVGHGVGRSMHEPPNVPNLGVPGSGEQLVEGLVIAIEPMVNIGGPDVMLGPDGWTVTTKDGSLSAHWEHTVAITSRGPRILTSSQDGNS